VALRSAGNNWCFISTDAAVVSPPARSSLLPCGKPARRGRAPRRLGRADGHHDDYPDVIAAPADFGVNVSADDG